MSAHQQLIEAARNGDIGGLRAAVRESADRARRAEIMRSLTGKPPSEEKEEENA